MESTTGFSLKNSIAEWKAELIHHGLMTSDNLEELESHLLDEIQELQKLGLSAEEALLVAKNRLGTSEELTAEFSKVNRDIYFRNKITPYLKGVLIFITFIGLADLLAKVSALIALGSGLKEQNLYLVSSGSLVIITFLVLLIFYKAYRQVGFKPLRFISIPILVGTIAVSQVLTYLCISLLSRFIGGSDYGLIQISIIAHKVFFGLFLLVSSSVLYYSKKKNKPEIASQ